MMLSSCFACSELCNQLFLWSAKKNVLPLVRLCSALGADTNTTDVHGKSALHIATQRGSEDLLAWLLWRTDCDVNAKSIFGDTPLHMAVRVGNITAVKRLIQGAERLEFDTRNMQGQTPAALVVGPHPPLVMPEMSNERERARLLVILVLAGASLVELERYIRLSFGHDFYENLRKYQAGRYDECSLMWLREFHDFARR